ncbi:hypothetical protein DL93DRAFT_2084432 [Clavulina sp. PMI_390]|nr:hypothetical protein DL93DRAFT_2084432 [Clavulina sp. PMI_390]
MKVNPSLLDTPFESTLGYYFIASLLCMKLTSRSTSAFVRESCLLLPIRLVRVSSSGPTSVSCLRATDT